MTAPQFQCLFWLTRNIRQDDLDKTIVSVALCCSSTIRGTKRLASLQSPRIQVLRKIGGVPRLRRPQNGSASTLILPRGWPWTPTCREPPKAACERTLRLQNETTPPSDLRLGTQLGPGDDDSGESEAGEIVSSKSVVSSCDASRQFFSLQNMRSMTFRRL